MAGYSKKSLVDKLGIKAGFTVHIVNPPENYGDALGWLPEASFMAEKLEYPLDFIHFFTKDRTELEATFPTLKQALAYRGMLWVSWPKKASKVKTDLNENIVREVGLKNGLVDVKVVAVDETWSGLKFVYRVKDRK